MEIRHLFALNPREGHIHIRSRRLELLEQFLLDLRLQGNLKASHAQRPTGGVHSRNDNAHSLHCKIVKVRFRGALMHGKHLLKDCAALGGFFFFVAFLHVLDVLLEFGGGVVEELDEPGCRKFVVRQCVGQGGKH
ncbi:hypothetical protein HIM_03780 [Hirsutella minnesotensis 3608]|uniref:Uncharacterized protein n=1 Tax=Hirsutella minnesotensis 3608 TaxID=1043627 RepID=A0A0F7ZVN1_9HYPO|nr:hypothetical protein HIM_03780 [Hirsutella minnesotensis 3608]